LSVTEGKLSFFFLLLFERPSTDADVDDETATTSDEERLSALLMVDFEQILFLPNNVRDLAFLQ